MYANASSFTRNSEDIDLERRLERPELALLFPFLDSEDLRTCPSACARAREAALELELERDTTTSDEVGRSVDESG